MFSTIEKIRQESEAYAEFSDTLLFDPLYDYHSEARDAANYCKNLFQDCGIDGPIHLLTIPYGFAIDNFCSGKGLKSFGIEKMLKRICNPSVWRQKIRKLARSNSEEMNRTTGLVASHKQQYCSDQAVGFRNFNLRAQERYAKDNEFVNNVTGKVVQIPGVEEKRHSRMSKKYNEAKGKERIALAAGFTWVFMSITLEPVKHSCPSKGQNSFDGTSVVDANKLLSERWEDARGLLRYHYKQSFLYSMAREPHGDGTPHAHILMYVPPNEEEEIERIIKKEFANPYDFTGTTDKAVSFIWNDGRATPTSYIMADIMKGVGVEKYKGTKVDHIENMDSWAYAHSIRRWSSGGLVPVGGIWDEVRRAFVMETMLPETMHAIQSAAVEGDYFKFYNLLVDEDGQKQIEFLKEDSTNSYNEPTERIIGLVDANTGDYVITHVGKYIQRLKTVENKGKLTVRDSYPRELAGSDPPIAKYG